MAESELKTSSKITVVTCYDFTFSKALSSLGILDFFLVGDSAANVIYGDPSTTSISLETLTLHCKAVRRGMDAVGASVQKKPKLMVDLPAGTYLNPSQAWESSQKLINAGAEIVKLEGPEFEVVRALRDKGVSVCGHLGFTPQTIQEARVQGRTEQEAQKIFEDASKLTK